MIQYPCPITAGQQTRMVKASFMAMCAARREEATHQACAECRGKKIPAELEFIELNKEETGVAKLSGECEQCGKEGVSNLVKSHGKLCCPSCGVLRAGIKNHPDLVREIIAEFYGEQKDIRPPAGEPAAFPDLAAIRKILDCREDETIADASTRQMQRLYNLDTLYHDAQEEVQELHGKLNTAQPKEGNCTTMAAAITQACIVVRDFLLEKNESYGNSAADPVRIFSKADPLEQINVRIDDKLSRMIRGGSYPGDNDEQDLLGYLILKLAVRIFRASQERIAA